MNAKQVWMAVLTFVFIILAAIFVIISFTVLQPGPEPPTAGLDNHPPGNTIRSVQERVAAAQAQVEALSRTLQCAIFAQNDSGEILIINVGFCKLLGLNTRPEDLIGTPAKSMRQLLGPRASADWDIITSIAGERNQLKGKEVTVNDQPYRLSVEPILVAKNKIGSLWVLTPGSNKAVENKRDLSFSWIEPLLYWCLISLLLSFVAILSYGYWRERRAAREWKKSADDYKVRIEALSRTLQCAIFAQNDSGKILIINVGFCKLLGLNTQPEDLIGTPAKSMRQYLGSRASADWDTITSIAGERSQLKGKEVTVNDQPYRLSVEPISVGKNKIGSLWVLLPMTGVINIEERVREVAKVQLWQEKPATGPWAPAEFHGELRYTASFEYTDAYSRADPGLPGWSLIGATRRGRSHAHKGTYRDDAFRWAVGQNFAVACVSDGAGSSKYSRIGAETICRSVCDNLARRLDDSSFQKKVQADSPNLDVLSGTVGGYMKKAVLDGCKELVEVARKLECEQKDFRCTLLLAVHCNLAGTELILTSQIGDGFIVALHKDGQCKRYGTSDSGDFSGEVSCFVPDPEVRNKVEQINSARADDIEALLLCTDGIEDPFFPIERKAGALFSQLYEGVMQKLDGFENQVSHGPVLGEGGDYRRIEEWLAFEKRGENDDRTLVMLYRKPVEISPDKIKLKASNTAVGDNSVTDLCEDQSNVR